MTNCFSPTLSTILASKSVCRDSFATNNNSPYSPSRVSGFSHRKKQGGQSTKKSGIACSDDIKKEKAPNMVSPMAMIDL